VGKDAGGVLAQTETVMKATGDLAGGTRQMGLGSERSRTDQSVGPGDNV
jgi:hypothetical protein